MSTATTTLRAGIIRGIDTLSDWTGRGIAWLTLAMALCGVAVVVLRYGFGMGLVWLQESVTWLHAAVFMLGAGWTLRQDGHVRVDVFYRRMSPRQQALVDLAGTLVFLLPLCGYLLVESLPYVINSWRILERSREAGGLPGLYLVKSLIPLMALLLGLAGVAEALRAWARFTARPEH